MAENDFLLFRSVGWFDAKGVMKQVNKEFHKNPILETWLSNIFVKQDGTIKSTIHHIPQEVTQSLVKKVQGRIRPSVVEDLKGLNRDEKKLVKATKLSSEMMEGIAMVLPKSEGRSMVPKTKDYSAVYEQVEKWIQNFQILNRVPQMMKVKFQKALFQVLQAFLKNQTILDVIFTYYNSNVLKPYEKIKLDQIMMDRKRTNWLCVVSGYGSSYCTNIMDKHPIRQRSTYFTFTRKGELKQRCSVKGIGGVNGTDCFRYHSEVNDLFPNRIGNPLVIQILTTKRMARVQELDDQLAQQEAKKTFANEWYNKFPALKNSHDRALFHHMEHCGATLYRIRKHLLKKKEGQGEEKKKKRKREDDGVGVE